MFVKIHQLLITPGGTAKIYCKDGLSSATVYQIEHLYNFGGDLKFVNCGAANIFAGTVVAAETMRLEVYDMTTKQTKPTPTGCKNNKKYNEGSMGKDKY